MPQILRVLLVSLTLILSSCSNAGSQPAEPSLPTDFSVRWGHGGGLSGQWSGRRVSPEGTLSSWSIAYRDGGEHTRVIGKLAEHERRAMWTALEEHGFFTHKASMPLEWSSTIVVTADGSTHRVSWEPLDARLDGLYARLVGLARRPNE